MKLLLNKLEEIKQRKNKPALMTHVVLGYPTLNASIKIVKAMAKAGADIIELQIPFSDPMADGPTIMAANEEAINNGLKVKDCFKAVKQLSKEVKVPLIFMSYYNILFRYNKGKDGVKNFCKDAASAGIQGLIVPDVPPEENADGFWTYTKQYNLLAIPIVSPVSSNQRLKVIKNFVKQGFIYCVSTTGTTGARKSLPPDLNSYLKKVKAEFKLPLAVGFGISTKEQVAAVCKIADIAIVGSAMIDQIRKQKKSPEKAAFKFTRELLNVTKKNKKAHKL